MSGRTLEEEAADVGYRLGWSGSWAVVGGGDGGGKPSLEMVSLARQRGPSRSVTEDGVDGAGLWSDAGVGATRRGVGLGALVEMEQRRARAWLAADRVLGLVALLGPGPVSRGTAFRRRTVGYLSPEGAMTTAGWWRLSFLARQGVGPTEWYRQRRLSEGRIARHLKVVRKACLALMEEGCVPLGVEYSATAVVLGKMNHRYRPDALLVDPQGRLIWLEVMLRPLARLSEGAAIKYRLMDRDVFPLVADQIEAPVRYILRLPSGVETKEYRPLRVRPF